MIFYLIPPVASMLDYPGVLRKFCRGTTHAISCTSDEEVHIHP